MISSQENLAKKSPGISFSGLFSGLDLIGSSLLLRTNENEFHQEGMNYDKANHGKGKGRILR